MPTDRLAVAAYFAVLGLVCTAWASSIDDLKLLLGLTPSQQGWLLFSGPLGNLVSFTFASSLLERVGVRRGLRVAGVLYLLAAAGLAACFHFHAPLPYWCVAIAGVGGIGNIYNIAVNTQGGTVERRLGRIIMNSFHAVFSLMCLFGGLLALGFAAFGLPVAWRFALVLAVSAVIQAWAFRSLPADDIVARTEPRRGWRLPDRVLLSLGLAGLVVMGCEGAVSDWVGVFYRETLKVDSAKVKLGFCAVTGLMAVGRFITDGIVERLGAKKVFRSCCLLVSLGLALSLSTPYFGVGGAALLWLVTLGFAIVGLGISALVPILYSRANRTRSMPAASAITFVGSMGFLGFFVGPPLIGQLAEATSYSVALGVFAVLILACLALDPER